MIDQSKNDWVITNLETEYRVVGYLSQALKEESSKRNCGGLIRIAKIMKYTKTLVGCIFTHSCIKKAKHWKNESFISRGT